MPKRDSFERQAERIAEQVAADVSEIDSLWRITTRGWPWQASADTYLRYGIEEALSGVGTPADVLEPIVREVDYHLRHQPREARDQVMLTAVDVMQTALWNRGKVIYQMDADLWNELADTEDNATIPGEVFTRLPHPNPYVALPEPLTTTMADGSGLLRVTGFFVTGRAPRPGGRGDMMCSTDDPAMTHLSLMFNGGILDPGTGKRRKIDAVDGTGAVYRQWDGTLSRTSIKAVTMTLADQVKQAVAVTEEATADYDPDFASGLAGADVLARMTRTAIISLVYLCSDAVDTGRPAIVGNRSRRRRVSGQRPITVLPVGFRIGAALRAHRTGQRGRGGEPTGRTVAPHLRRAHFHTFLAGPGKTERRVKWLAPIPVNMTREDVASVPTIHKVG